MAGRSGRNGEAGGEPVLPGDLDLDALYAASGSAEAEDEEQVMVPPVRLSAEAELAPTVRQVPLLAQAVRLARWVGEGRLVDEFGELGAEAEAEAAAALDPESTDAGEVARVWALAVDLALVALEGEPERAVPGPALALLEGGDDAAVLDLWTAAADLVLDTAVEAAVDDDELETEAVEAAVASVNGAAPDAQDALEESEEEYTRAEQAREAAQDLVDDALHVLYEARAFASDLEGETVPLGVVAALLVTPEGQDPGPDELGEITDVMVALDPIFQDLAEVGFVEYQSIDPALFEEGENAAVPQEEDEDGEFARYGRVRLTDLGLYGMHRWFVEDGYDAPLVGEHAEGDAAQLLQGVCTSANVLPLEEVGVWLAVPGREPAVAAAELLEAARGDDMVAPMRRYYARAALDLIGDPAEAAVRAALEDAELSGVALGWLAARGEAELPEPAEAVRYWNLVDALAAALVEAAGDAEAMREAALELPLDPAEGAWLDELWRVEHAYTGVVLEALGELHPDRSVAKRARKAAYKAKSHGR